MNPDDDTPWQYKPDDDGSALEQSDGSAPAPARRGALQTVSWEAPQFIEHQHGAQWYLSLIVITAGLAALVYLVARDYIATGTIAVVGVIVGIFAGHKPQTVRYEINDSGLAIGEKRYKYSDYKSFAVISEGQLSSLNLFPLKRFMPPLTAYFEPSNEQAITDALGDHLPYEQRRLDAVDRLSRRLHL